MSPQGPLPSVAEPISTPPAEDLDFTAFAVIGSRVRLAILKELARGERSIADLVKALGLHRPTLRYHLSFLLQKGLVEEVAPRKGGRAGRPATLYRAARRAVVSGFPPRRYDLLAGISLQTLVDGLGLDEAAAQLKEKGREAGRSMVDAAGAKGVVTDWSPRAFREIVLEGLLRDFGVETEIVEESEEALRYRVFTCPFLEMAQRLPALVCDALDVGFHGGMDEAVGGETQRFSCMGHGASYCEYIVAWRERGLRSAEARKGAGVDDV